MAERRYTKDHEWIELNGSVGTVGITNYAQEQLGDVVFVELPASGKKLTKGGEAAVVESVKAASDLYAPVAGTVVAINSALEGTPETVNRAPFGEGWMIRLKPAAADDGAALLDAAAYEQLVG